VEHGYPGKEIGYFSDRLTYKLFNLMSKNADCVLNYHGGVPGLFEAIDYVMIECPPDIPEDFRENNRKIAEVYGLDVITEMPTKREVWASDSLHSQQGLHPLMPMLMPQLNLKGILSVGVLHGAGPMAAPLDRHVQGIFNVMMHLGMVDGEPKVPEKYKRCSGYVVIRPRNSGMFKSHLKAGDRVKKGQLIATIYNLFGEEIEKINSPVDGLAIMANTYPFIDAGQYECYAFEIFF
jgi:predicted deacylase